MFSWLRFFRQKPRDAGQFDGCEREGSSGFDVGTEVLEEGLLQHDCFTDRHPPAGHLLAERLQVRLGALQAVALEESQFGPARLDVLVADDDPELLNLISSHARSIEGAEVIEASDGEEALRLARSERPALVLLDVMMPGMSGWEVCRAIREEEGLRSAKVIMLTGIGERLNEMTSPLYGADAYLDKPFDLDDLSDRIEDLVGRRPQG